MEAVTLTQEAKRTLENVRKKLEFDEPPDHLIKFQCQNCSNIAVLDHIAECKHLFCGKCYHKICKRPCPVENCDNTCIENVVQDEQYEKDIAVLKLYCPFKSYGCDEVTTLSQYFEHQSKCSHLQNALLSKPYARQTSNYKMLDEDYSTLKNSIEDMDYQIRSQEDALKALELRITTEQLNSEDRILKEMIDENSKQYEDVKTLVETKIASSIVALKNELGESFTSQFDVFKKDLIPEMENVITKIIETKLETKTPNQEIETSKTPDASFEDSGIENSISLEQKLTERNKELEQKIQQLTEANETLRNELKQIMNTTKDHAAFIEAAKNNNNQETESSRRKSVKRVTSDSSSKYVWKIKDFDKILENLGDNLEGFESECFNLNGYDAQIKAQLKRHEDHLSIYLAFVYDTNNDKIQRPVYFHRRSFAIIDQSDNPNKKDIVRICEPSFGRQIAEQWMTDYWGSLKFVPLSLLSKNDTYVKDGVIVIHIIIEPLTKIYLTASSNDGIMFLRFDNYRNQKQDEISGVSQGIKSHSFYTSPHGYRMQFEVCLNGYGEENKGKYISAFLWFRRGRWDDFLSRNFQHKVKIMILDQSNSEDKEHLSYTYKYNQVFNRSYSKLILQSAIENSVYLKDNSLLIMISVLPTRGSELSDDPLGKAYVD